MYTICGWVDITDFIPPDNEDNGSGNSGGIQSNASLSDPNSTWDFTLDDINQTLNIKNAMPVIVFDENAPALAGVPTVPTINFLNNPSLDGSPLSGNWSVSGTLPGTVWDYTTGNPRITVNNNALGFSFQVQDLDLGNIVPGVEYMYSIYQQGSGTISNLQSVMWIQWYDALNNQIGSTITQVLTPTLSQQRISLSAVAPVGTVSAIVFFGGQTTVAGSNSGSILFSTAQFEAMWFVNKGVNYPTPDCNHYQVNSILMPDGTTSRACRRFAGYVENRTNSYAGTQRHIQVQCASTSKILETVGLISYSATATQDTTILTNVLSQVVNNTSFISQISTGQQNFFAPTSTLIPGVIVDSISWNNATLRQVLNDLGSQSGSLYYVDPYYYLWYVPPSFANSTIMLSDTPDNITSFPYSNFSIEYDYTNPVNVAMVVGSKQKAAVVTEQFNGTGSQTVFTLTYPPDNVHGLSVGGVSTRAGVDGVDNTPSNNKFGPTGSGKTYQAVVNKQTKALTFATAPASGTNNVSISYTYEDQVISQVIAADSVADQGAQFWGLVNDSAITSTKAAKNRGLAELASYAYERVILTFDLLNIYMPIGSLALFTNQSEGFTNAPFVIQTVQSDLKGGGQDNWQYTAGVYNPTIIDHLRNATKAIQKSPTTANVVVIASIDVALFDSLHVNDSIAANVSAYASAAGVDSPNGYWRLGETRGTTAYDLSGNGYNGTIASGVTLNQAGALVGDPNASMLLNGTSGFISTPINFSGATAQTLECWVKPSNLTYASFPRFMANDNNGSTTVSMFLGSNPAGAGLFFHVGNGTATAEATTTFQLSTTAWTHVVGTWDGTTLTIYVNGVSAGTNTLSGALGTTTFTMDIGKETHSGNAWWPGLIDEVAVYPTALSATRVLAHYNAGI